MKRRVLGDVPKLKQRTGVPPDTRPFRGYPAAGGGPQAAILSDKLRSEYSPVYEKEKSESNHTVPGTPATGKEKQWTLLPVTAVVVGARGL